MKLLTVALSIAAKASVAGRNIVKGPSWSKTDVMPAPVTATLAPCREDKRIRAFCCNSINRNYNKEVIALMFFVRDQSSIQNLCMQEVKIIATSAQLKLISIQERLLHYKSAVTEKILQHKAKINISRKRKYCYLLHAAWFIFFLNLDS